MKHNYPVTYWGHLPPVEKDGDRQGLLMDGEAISHLDLHKVWKGTTLKEWDKNSRQTKREQELIPYSHAWKPASN